MAKLNEIETFPFRKEHLKQFKKELKMAGSFDELMLQKKAIQRKMGMKYIEIYKDIDQYKSTFLTGAYESLRPFYETEMPYVFWSALHEIILNNDEKQQ
ncbi:MAG TPA: hypothetical protein VJY62_04930 [Bacteroidia bacterium]|nr:hypothetical protein [Bacteroidia bacterium]